MHSARSKLPTSSAARSASEKRILPSISRIPLNVDDTNALDIRNRQSILSANRLSNSAYKAPASGIKSALKNTLYTPQAQKSSLAFSAVHSSSKKNTLSGGDRRPILDERPLIDRSYHEQCIQRLVEFFGSDSQEAKIVRQFSISMPTKDVENICKTLLQFLGFTITAVPFESEVQRILKDLGYPFLVNKSSLQSISTAKGRGSVLGMLDWLVSCVSYYQKVNVERLLFGQPDDPEQLIVTRELLRLVLLNDTENDTRELEQIAFNKFGSADQINQLNEEMASLDHELKLLQQQINRERAVPITVKELKAAVDQLEKYANEMRQYIDNNQQNLCELVKTNENQDKELQMLQDQLKQVQAEVRSQKVSVEDVERCNQQTRQLQTEINAVESDVIQTLNERDVLQLQKSQRRLELERRCSEVSDWYTQMLARLNSPAVRKRASSMLALLLDEQSKSLLEKFENPNFESGFEEMLCNFEKFVKTIRHNFINVNSELQREVGISRRHLSDLEIREKELLERTERLRALQKEYEAKLETTKQGQREEKSKILEENEQFEKKISKFIADIRALNEKKEKMLQDESDKIKEEYEEIMQEMQTKLETINQIEKIISNTKNQIDQIHKTETLVLTKKRERLIRIKELFIKQVERKLKLVH